MNQRNNNQTDKYSDMLKWLSDKIKYTKNGRMYEDYYKVSEEYQKDKEGADPLSSLRDPGTDLYEYR